MQFSLIMPVFATPMTALCSAALFYLYHDAAYQELLYPSSTGFVQSAPLEMRYCTAKGERIARHVTLPGK